MFTEDDLVIFSKNLRILDFCQWIQGNLDISKLV